MSYEQVSAAADFIRAKYSREIKVAVVLGSGLGAFAEELQDAISIPFSEIPNFARSTVEGHSGKLVIGSVEGIPVAVQQGRFHYYEGNEIQKVVLPVRTFGLLGIKTLILTNAAGSVRTSLKPGTLMLIRDHLNLMGVNPLRGENDARFGVRFPDMTEIYSRRLQEIASVEAGKISEERFRAGAEKTLRPLLRRGIYAGLAGPSYETPAEIRMLSLLGADAVGMSTVPEAIAARHQGMKVLGISCITNFAAGMMGDVIKHEEVLQTGEKVREIFSELLRRIIPKVV